MAGGPGGQLGVLRDHAQRLLLGEDLLPLGVPAVGELAGVLVRPFQRNLVRGVGGAGREVGEERLVRGQRLLRADPVDAVVGQVVGEVVALLRGLLRFHRVGALVQRRVVLVVLAADESVEVLEPAAAGRPRIERADRGRLPRRHLVALAELGGRVPVELQRGGQRRLGVRPEGVGARGGRRDLGDPAHPDRVVVPAAEQRRPGRRAQRGGVEPVVGQPVGLQPLGGRHLRRPAEHAAGAVADVVEQHDQHVRCALRRQQRLDRRERGVRVLRVVGHQTQVLPVRDRQTSSTRAQPIHHESSLTRGCVRRRFCWSTISTAPPKMGGDPARRGSIRPAFGLGGASVPRADEIVHRSVRLFTYPRRSAREVDTCQRARLVPEPSREAGAWPG